MNKTDSFEAIAKDAVQILATIVDALRQNEDPEAALVGLILGAKAEDLCHRAIALGGV